MLCVLREQGHLVFCVVLVLCFYFLFLLPRIAGDGRKTVLLKSAECSTEVLNFLANKACQCYMALCDWPSVLEWQASVQALKKNSSATPAPPGIHLKMDLNYIQALGHFEDGDFDECRAQLDLLPGEDCSLLNATASKDKLGKLILTSCPGRGNDPPDIHDINYYSCRCVQPSLAN